MSNSLRSKVIAATLEAAAKRGDRERIAYDEEADAAIAICMEEAAKVAETCFGPKDEALTVGEASGYDLAMDRIATAIRAMIPKVK